MSFRQGDVRHQVPRLEFICLNGFDAIMLGEALSQIAGRADVGLAGRILASQEISVVHPPSLPSNFGGLDTARLRLPD
jgi:hypothetical protein